VVVTLGAVGLIVFETVLLVYVGPSGPWRWYLLGLLHSGIALIWLAYPYYAFVVSDREAIGQLRGAWGEENTRDELKIAKRRRIIWDSVDGIPLQQGDLDHLVVTRRAGLVAIDSKWRTESANPADMALSAGRMRMRARL
jgi:hypothetical protein